MTVYEYNFTAGCVEIGRTDFHAANLAAASARRAGIAADARLRHREFEQASDAFVKAQEPACEADRMEAETHISTAQHAATLVQAFARQMEQNLAPTTRAGFAEDDADFMAVIADAVADRFARSPELARVFRASLAMGAI